MSEASTTPAARPRDLLAGMRTPSSVRQRCAAVTQAVSDGRSGHFRIDRGALPALAERLAAMAAGNPREDRSRPLVSFWHDLAGSGAGDAAEFETQLAELPVDERRQARIDLAVVGSLLGADPGSGWRYRDGVGAAAVSALALPAHHLERDDLFRMLDQAARPASDAAPKPPCAAAGAPATEPAGSEAPSRAGAEGLALAAWRAFAGGAFSSSRSQPLRADAAALKLVDPVVVRTLLQSSVDNPLVGVEGRAGLLARLGEGLQAEATRYGGVARPALLLDRLTDGGQRSELSASELLQGLLRVLGPVWRGGSTVMGVPAGDVWPHPFAGVGGGDTGSAGFVPLHQAGQWLARSLIEPLQHCGVTVTDLQALTGLPGLTIGGLLVDAGLLVPRRERDAARRWPVGSEFVVEWRAVTVTLLDELAAASGLPVDAAMVACRGLGAAVPPLAVDGDGTLF